MKNVTVSYTGIQGEVKEDLYTFMKREMRANTDSIPNFLARLTVLLAERKNIDGNDLKSLLGATEKEMRENKVKIEVNKPAKK